MTKRPDGMPWSKFWWQDYDRDPALRRCSLEAQGFWMRVLCIMAEAEPYGRLLVGGTMPSDRELARMVGCGVTERAAAKMLAELRSMGVYSVDNAGVPFCRRMVREQEVRVEARANGAKGGNPALRKQRGNSAENTAENSENTKRHTGEVSGNNSGLGDLGVNPSGNPPDKLQEARSQNQNSGSLRSPAAVAAAGLSLSLPEQSASAAAKPAAGADLFGPPSPAPPAAPPQPTLKSVLFAEGMPKLIEMTGRPRDKLASWIGRMRKESGDDDAMILALVQDAHRRWLAQDTALADPVGWISAGVKGRIKARAKPEAEVPAVAGGRVVADIVRHCGDLMEAECDGAWPGFSAMVAEMLSTGASPEKHIFPVMKGAVRKGVRTIDSAGYFRFAISARLHGTEAAA